MKKLLIMMLSLILLGCAKEEPVQQEEQFTVLNAQIRAHEMYATAIDLTISPSVTDATLSKVQASTDIIQAETCINFNYKYAVDEVMALYKDEVVSLPGDFAAAYKNGNDANGLVIVVAPDQIKATKSGALTIRYVQDSRAESGNVSLMPYQYIDQDRINVAQADAATTTVGRTAWIDHWADNMILSADLSQDEVTRYLYAELGVESAVTGAADSTELNTIYCN